MPLSWAFFYYKNLFMRSIYFTTASALAHLGSRLQNIIFGCNFFYSFVIFRLPGNTTKGTLLPSDPIPNNIE